MPSNRWWAVFIGVTAVELLLLVKLLIGQPSIEIFITIVVVAALLVLILRIEDIKSVTINKNGLDAKLSKFEEKVEKRVNKIQDNLKDEVKEKVNQLGDDINDLLISTVLDAYEYITLRKINGEEKNDNYEFNYPKGQDLLERLRNRGLIEEKNNDSIFNDLSNRSIKAREHFSITERGKKYLTAINQKGLGKALEKIVKLT